MRVNASQDPAFSTVRTDLPRSTQTPASHRNATLLILFSVPTRHSLSFERCQHNRATEKCFRRFSQNCEKRRLASSCPSVRMEQLDSHGTDFHEILYLIIFRKYVEKIQLSLHSNKNDGHFTCRPTYMFIVSRSVLLRIKNVLDKICTENKSTYFMFNHFFSFRKSYRL